MLLAIGSIAISFAATAVPALAAPNKLALGAAPTSIVCLPGDLIACFDTGSGSYTVCDAEGCITF